MSLFSAGSINSSSKTTNTHTQRPSALKASVILSLHLVTFYRWIGQSRQNRLWGRLLAEWGASSCLCDVLFPVAPPGTELGSVPSRERASFPTGLVVTAAPGPWPGWLGPGRRLSEVWEASAGPTAAPSRQAGDWDRAACWALEHGPMVGRGNCRVGRDQWGLRHDYTRGKEMGQSPLVVRISKDNSLAQDISASCHVTVLLSSCLFLMESTHKTRTVNKLWENFTSHLFKSWGNDGIAKVIMYLSPVGNADKCFKPKQSVTQWQKNNKNSPCLCWTEVLGMSEKAGLRLSWGKISYTDLIAPTAAFVTLAVIWK